MTTTQTILRATRRTWEEMVELLPVRLGVRVQVQMLHCAATTLNVSFEGDDAALVLDIADDFNQAAKEDTPADQIERMRANADSCVDPDFVRAFCDSWERDLLNSMLENEVVEI